MRETAKIATGRVIMPARLPERERNALSHQLYAVHKRIFSGVAIGAFHSHVVEPPAAATWIQLYLSDSGSVIGYCAVHRYWRQIGNREAIVLRAEAGLMPEYRGRSATYGFGIIRAVFEKLTHPFTPIYYLGTLVHPSSYHLFCKYFPRVYPHPHLETPAAVLKIAQELIESFPDPAADPTDPFVRDVGWVTIETSQETSLTAQADRQDVKFFRARNPDYAKGFGLVVLVPMTPRNLLNALLRRFRERVLLAFGRRQTHL